VADIEDNVMLNSEHSHRSHRH